jgi:tRNA (guanine26-N2/guanine27-N2)-dimethyltransferase
MYSNPNDPMAVKIKKAANKAKLQPRSSQSGITILEGLAATGLRSVRYAKEILQTDTFKVKKIVANDFDAGAVESIRRNARYNSVQDVVVPSQGDANYAMHHGVHTNQKFDVIDLVG